MQSIKASLLCFIQHKFDFTPVNRRFGLAFFTTAFAFVFANFFEPFGIYHDPSMSMQEVFVQLFVAMTFAFVVITIAQFIVRPLIKRYHQNIWETYVWFLSEGIVCATIWTALQKTLDSSRVSDISTPLLWFENLVGYTALIAIPYLLFIFYLYHNDRLTMIQTAKEKEDKEQHNIAILDESGETKLILHSNNLLFVSSADNYVEINYLENESLQKMLIRNSLKNIENSLLNTKIIRCHRSFILNTTKIESATKTTSGFNVKMQNIPDTVIPVSKSYISELKKHIEIPEQHQSF